jgi:hypothetical protein
MIPQSLGGMKRHDENNDCAQKNLTALFQIPDRMIQSDGANRGPTLDHREIMAMNPFWD